MDELNQEKMFIRNCPFCGGSARFKYWLGSWWVQCEGEVALVSGVFDPEKSCYTQSPHRSTKKAAALAWNTRFI